MADGMIKVKFSEKLVELLEILEDNDNYLAFELLWMSEQYFSGNPKYHNGLGITHVDVGVPTKASDFNFIVTIKGKKLLMKIGKFIRYYFPKLYDNNQITSFIWQFNKIKNGGTVQQAGVKIEVEEFKYNPKDPRSTFLSLVTKTYPYGHEEEVLQFLPKD